MAIFLKSKKKPKHKSVIIGLDGVPFSFLNELSENGKIQHMSSIFTNGHFCKMRVCLPEISSVSWSSFMTGTQSGEHGIYGFVDLIPGSYKMYFPNFKDLKKRTIFDELGSMGKRSVVINLPSTYPSRSIPGVLISGFVAVDLKKAIYPPNLYTKIKRMGYSIDIDTKRGREDSCFLFHSLDETLKSRQALGEMLWENEDWDLFMLVITGTDRLNHFQWEAASDPLNDKHLKFIQYYQKVDEMVGVFYNKFMDLRGSKEGRNHFIMLSDHGFTGIRSEVYLNKWLKENGYLYFKSDHPKSWEDIRAKSKAFAMDPSRIYINKKNRYENGSVGKDDAKKIKAEIASGLRDLTFKSGSRVLKKIFDRDEIYHGPYTKYGPDLVLLSNNGFDLKGKIDSPSVFGRSGLQGMHTQDDAFFFSTTGQKSENIFSIKNIILNGYR